MAWASIENVKSKGGHHAVTACVRTWASTGSCRVLLTLSAELHKKLGKPEYCQVQHDPERPGAIRLDFDVRGLRPNLQFKLNVLRHEIARVQFPAPAAVARQATISRPCELLEGDGPLVLELPLAAWALSSEKPSKPKTKGGAPTASGGGRPKVDPVVYLAQKGHGVERWTNGRFKIDGELKTAQEVLHKVNIHRIKANLPPLPSVDDLILA